MVGFVEMGVGLTGWRISANSGQSEVPAAIALRCEALKEVCLCGRTCWKSSSAS